MTPSDVLALRRGLLAMAETRPRVSRHHDDTWEIDAALEDVADLLPTAEMFYVSADMTAVAKAAAATMPSQPLLADDLPSDTGMMLWDAPPEIIDYSEGPVPVAGIAWGFRHQTNLPYWGDTEFPTSVTVVPFNSDDPAHQSRWRDAARSDRTILTDRPTGFITGHELVVYLLVDGWTLGAGSHQLIPAGSCQWWVGSEPGEMANDPGSLAATILATWTLMQQSLTVTGPAVVQRAERRRNQRAELPSDVVVVRLRRKSTDGEISADTAAAVDWSHRWLVGGHWRNQWLPSRQAHRLQWIAPYVKGPANLPLVIKDKVTAWIR